MGHYGFKEGRASSLFALRPTQGVPSCPFPCPPGLAGVSPHAQEGGRLWGSSGQAGESGSRASYCPALTSGALPAAMGPYDSLPLTPFCSPRAVSMQMGPWDLKGGGHTGHNAPSAGLGTGSAPVLCGFHTQGCRERGQRLSSRAPGGRPLRLGPSAVTAPREEP